MLGNPPLLNAFVRAGSEALMAMLEQLLERAGVLDHELRVFVSGEPVREDVLAQARALLERWPDPEDRPPLFGVPVGVKDIFRVAGRPTRCGALLPADLFDGPEAEVVAALRAAGAIILGKTETTEFAFFEPGATCNPHAQDHTPGGSSSGSAAGVAAGFFPLALGTQTVGSVVRPASYCGVTGFKPSLHRLPSRGLVYFSPTIDHVGLFCATPDEAATVMAALCPGWRAGIGTNAAAPLRLGVPEGPYLAQASADSLGWLRSVVSALKSAEGVEVVAAPCLEDIEAVAERHTDLIAAEFALEHAAWFDRYRQLYRPRTAAMVERGRTVDAEGLARARASCLVLRETLHAVLAEHRLDAFVCPSTLGEADAGLGSTGSPAMNLPWTHSGLPSLSLPVGQGGQGLPLGLQLVGRFGADEELLALGERVWGILGAA